MTRSIAELLRDTTKQLKQAGLDNPTREARHLVALATDMDMGRLTLERDRDVGEGIVARLGVLVSQRCARKPLSHITGKRAFWEHVFEVTPDVLDPRPETETLVKAALDGPFDRVLDLGTGSGAIILSLLAARSKAQGVATDISSKALEVAARNAAALGVGDRVAFIVSDWFAKVTGRFDLIVSNPPYIAAAEMSDLAPELHHEPRSALTDESDGLSAYRAILSDVRRYLQPGGRVLLEIGPTQAAAVTALCRSADLHKVEVLSDLDGRDRVVRAAAR